MAKRRVKAQEHEKLDDATLGRVISLLNDETSPITKKEACRLLNITYNTSRLNRIIEDFREKAEYIKRRKKENRLKPFSDYEVKEIILEYLKGTSKTQIAAMLYRPVTSIDNILERYNVPKRKTGKSSSYHKPEIIPDEALSETYETGELVWSAKYNCVVEILSLFNKDKLHGNVYRIWIFGKHNERGFQPWYELGKMPILKTLGITYSDVLLNPNIQMEYKIG